MTADPTFALYVKHLYIGTFELRDTAFVGESYVTGATLCIIPTLHSLQNISPPQSATSAICAHSSGMPVIWNSRHRNSCIAF